MSILAEIRARRERDVADAAGRLPLAMLERRLPDAPPARDFAGALRRADEIRLIAEIKRASPSAGVLRADFDPPAIARGYAAAGAAALSILTEPHWFQGSLEHLRQAREAVDLPILLKDFLCSRYQLVEARVAGADAALLIVAMLSPEELRTLPAMARDIGLAALIEVHNHEELDRALEAEAAIIGINNRDLKTMTVDTETTLRLRKHVPGDKTVVSESGIRDRATMCRLRDAGVHAALVGEALMRQPDPGAAAAALLNDPPL